MTIGPLGDVTYDMLKKMGMNVQLDSTDWGTVTQRRASKEPVDKGGWSILHTWAPSNVIGTPVEQWFIRGLGDKGWFGWYGDEKIEELTQAWLRAPNQAERDRFADEYQKRAFEQVPTIPCGQFQIRTAVRKSLQGQIEGAGAYMWNIRRT